MGPTSNGRFSPVFRWLGFTLVVLLLLQMAVVLSFGDWADGDYQQLVVERLVSQAPMGFMGLLLMLISSRLDYPAPARLPIRWFVCGLSGLLAVAMIVVTPMAISVNQKLASEVDQTLQQRRSQLEMARQQGQNPQALQMLGEQLAQAGQLSVDASQDDKQQAAQKFIDGQLSQMDQQIQQAEQQRNLAVNQRRYGGTLTAVVLAVVFVLLAFTAVL